MVDSAMGRTKMKKSLRCPCGWELTRVGGRLVERKALQYLAQLDSLIDSALRSFLFPGMVCLVRRRGEWIIHKARGVLYAEDESVPMDEDVIFDVASLTKVLVTAPSIMLLNESGELSIDDAVSRYLPAFAGGDRSSVTLRHLLTHSSGLPAWAPLYLFGRTREKMVDFLCRIPLEYRPGERIEYSCLGYVLLGQIVEGVAGMSLAEFARKHIFEPLGLRNTWFNPPKEVWSRVAPTEDGVEYERNQARAFLDRFRMRLGNEARWSRALAAASRRLESLGRYGLIRGEVHDCNAYFMGGVSGNAGLFSSAEEVERIAREFLVGVTGSRRPIILAQETMRAMVKCQKSWSGQRRGLGWDLVSDNGSSAGSFISRSSFGHTSFTGCSVWVDPIRELTIVVLSNAVCPRYKPEAMQRFRPALHDLVVNFSDCIFSLCLA